MPGSTLWVHRAACRDTDPNIFFTPRRLAEAQRICATCPVTAACREHGATAYRGVWGGQPVTATAPGPSKTAPYLEVHGTNSGYMRHLDRDETPCERCRAAHSFYENDRYWGRQAVSA